MRVGEETVMGYKCIYDCERGLSAKKVKPAQNEISHPAGRQNTERIVGTANAAHILIFASYEVSCKPILCEISDISANWQHNSHVQMNRYDRQEMMSSRLLPIW